MDAREAERKLDEWVNNDDLVLSFDEKREIRNAIDFERSTLRAEVEARDAEIAELYRRDERWNNELNNIRIEMCVALGMKCDSSDGLDTRKQAKFAGALKDRAREDAERIDWLENVLSLHQFVQLTYLVDSYELEIQYTDGRCDDQFYGETIRAAIDDAREE